MIDAHFASEKDILRTIASRIHRLSEQGEAQHAALMRVIIGIGVVHTLAVLALLYVVVSLR